MTSSEYSANIVILLAFLCFSNDKIAYMNLRSQLFQLIYTEEYVLHI